MMDLSSDLRSGEHMVWQKAACLSPKQSLSADLLAKKVFREKTCPKNSSRWQEESLCYAG